MLGTGPGVTGGGGRGTTRAVSLRVQKRPRLPSSALNKAKPSICPVSRAPHQRACGYPNPQVTSQHARPRTRTREHTRAHRHAHAHTRAHVRTC